MTKSRHTIDRPVFGHSHGCRVQIVHDYADVGTGDSVGEPVKHLVLEPLQLCRWVQAEFFAQGLAQVLVHLQCFAAPTRSAKCDDQLLVEPLIERVCGDQGPQLSYQLTMEAKTKISLD